MVSSQIGANFRGLRWEPGNEQEVVVLFGRLLDCLPSRLAIEFIQTGFPDCKAINIETQTPIWIELELYSSHWPEAIVLFSRPAGRCPGGTRAR